MAVDPVVQGVSSSRASRMPGLDLVKGASIIGVVLIHATPDHTDAFGRYVVEGVARLAVPCFLGVTGFLAGFKQTGPSRFRDYLIVFVRLHLLYGLVYGVLTALVHGVPDPLTLKFVVLRFGEAAYPGQYYFVILIQLFLVTGFLPGGTTWRSGAWVWGSAALAAAGLGLLVATPEIVQVSGLPDPAVRILATPNGLWLWFYYFALGAHLGARSRSHEPTTSPIPVIGAVVGLAVATLGLPRLPDWEGPLRFAYTYARVPIYVGATLVVLSLPRLARMPVWAPLARIGRDSFGIFVLNPAVLLLLTSVFGPPGSAAEVLLRTLVTVGVCVGLTGQLRRHLPWALP